MASAALSSNSEENELLPIQYTQNHADDTENDQDESFQQQRKKFRGPS